MLQAYDYNNKGVTLPKDSFEIGFCYQAVQNLHRDSGILNSGYQCDRDNILEFKATFQNNANVDTLTKKEVYVFVTHIKEIIFVGDKVIVKE